jgi:DNA-binding transcriptional ArsR family regulator
MEPQTREPGRGDNEGFDTWRALQEATDTPRADLLSDIAGHPKGAPSVEELAYVNPDKSEDAIRRHLRRLVDAQVVRVLEVEPGNRRRDFPNKFYTITDEARALFDQNGLFPREAWQRQYEAVEKTARIRDVEQMPRPESE